jgi:hypothetical protein
MKSLPSFVLDAFLVGACLFSSCATNSSKTDACCRSGGSVAVAARRAYSAEALAQGASRSFAHSMERRSSANEIWEHVTDSTQHEVVRETKPVISDDSELR